MDSNFRSPDDFAAISSSLETPSDRIAAIVPAEDEKLCTSFQTVRAESDQAGRAPRRRLLEARWHLISQPGSVHDKPALAMVKIRPWLSGRFVLEQFPGGLEKLPSP